MGEIAETEASPVVEVEGGPFTNPDSALARARRTR